MLSEDSSEHKNKFLLIVSQEYEAFKKQYQKLQNISDQNSETTIKLKEYSLMAISQAAVHIMDSAQQKQSSILKRHYQKIAWNQYLPDNQPISSGSDKWFKNKEKVMENCMKILQRYESEREQSLRSTQQNLSEVNEQLLKMRRSLTARGILDNNQTQRDQTEILDNQNENKDQEQKTNKDNHRNSQQMESQKQLDSNFKPTSSKYSNNFELASNISHQSEIKKTEKVLDSASFNQQSLHRQKISSQQKKSIIETKMPQEKQNRMSKKEEQEKNYMQEESKEQNKKMEISTKIQSNKGQEKKQEQKIQLKKQQSAELVGSPRQNTSSRISEMKKSIFEIEEDKETKISDKKYYKLKESPQRSKENSPEKVILENIGQSQEQKIANSQKNEIKQNKEEQELKSSQKTVKQKKSKKKKIKLNQTGELLEKLNLNLKKLYEHYYHYTNTKNKSLAFGVEPQGLDLNAFIKYIKQYEIAEGVEMIIGRNSIRQKISPSRKKSPSIQTTIIPQVNLSLDKKNKKQSKKEQKTEIKIKEQKEKPTSKKLKEENKTKKKLQQKDKDKNKKDKTLKKGDKQAKKEDLEKEENIVQEIKEEKADQLKDEQENFKIASQTSHLRLHQAETIKYMSGLFKKMALNSLWLEQKNFLELHDIVFEMKSEKSEYLTTLQKMKKETENEEQLSIKLMQIPQKRQFLSKLRKINELISEEKVNKTLNIQTTQNLYHAFFHNPNKLRSIVQKHTNNLGNNNNFQNHREDLIRKIRQHKQEEEQKHRKEVQKIMERYRELHDKANQDLDGKHSKGIKSKSLHKINSYAQVLHYRLQKQKEQLEKSRNQGSPGHRISRIQSENKLKNDSYLQKNNTIQAKKSSPKHSSQGPIENRIEIYRELNLPKLPKRKLREQSIYESLNLIDTKNEVQKIKKLISQSDQLQYAQDRSNQKKRRKGEDPFFKQYYEKERKKINETKQKNIAPLQNRMKFT